MQKKSPVSVQIKKQFQSGLFKLLTGGFLSAGISIIALPILTRIYTPELLGIYALYSSVIGFGIVICGLLYERAIPLIEDEDESGWFISRLFLLALLIALSYSLSFYVLIHFKYFDEFSDINSYFLTFIVFVGIYFGWCFKMMNSVAIRFKKYQLIARVQVFQSVISHGFQIALGIIYGGSLSLILSHYLKESGGIGIIFFRIKNKIRFFKKGHYQSFRKYFKFPLYNLPATAINSLNLYLPTVFIGGLHTAKMAGFYFIVQRSLGLLVTILSNALSSYFYGEASSYYRENQSQKIKSLFDVTSLISIIFAFCIIISLKLFAVDVCVWFFGSDWNIAGEIAVILSLLIGVRLVVRSVVQVFVVADKQNELVFYQFNLLLMSVLGLFIPHYMGQGLMSILPIYVSCSIFAYLAIYIRCFFIVKSFN